MDNLELEKLAIKFKNVEIRKLSQDGPLCILTGHMLTTRQGKQLRKASKDLPSLERCRRRVSQVSQVRL